MFKHEPPVMHRRYQYLAAGMLLLSGACGRCQAQVVLTPDKPVTLATALDEMHAPKIPLIAYKYLGRQGRLSLLEATSIPETGRRSRSTDFDTKPSSSFTAALQNAWKKGIVEESVEAYTEVLVQCQKEQSPALTTPFMRSDSQQAHCFRY
jgi:hypothetical protein